MTRAYGHLPHCPTIRSTSPYVDSRLDRRFIALLCIHRQRVARLNAILTTMHSC